VDSRRARPRGVRRHRHRARRPALRYAHQLHTGHAGRFNENVAANNRVALTVARAGRLLPAERAGAFSSEYASVVAFGCAALVSDQGEKRRALQMLLDKYFPEHRPDGDYRPLTDAEIDSTAVYRIDITHWTGKRHEKSE
jgi:nitroimidazol reductase NimA-like FMN-containing flavoprotein (pyridoxamine 5'-phosphate oxidase superfamily)